MMRLEWETYVSVKRIALGLLCTCMACSVSQAVDEMGSEMTAVPVPHGKQVVIDGDLSGWDLSGQEWVAVSDTNADRFNAKVAVMYDEDALYVSVDSSTGGRAMSNTNKPNERPWQGHDVEFRFVADPSAPYPLAVSEAENKDPSLKPYLKHVATVTAWLETITKTPYITVVQGPPYKGELKMEQCVGKDGTLVVFKESSPPGRYVMEARIPWKSANVETGKNPFKPGDKMTAFWTIIWPQMRVEFLSTAPAGGFGWAWHRMNIWGRILLSPSGNLTKKHGTMDEYLAKLEGSKDKGTGFEIELRSEMKASVSIIDKDGGIVRELIGGEPRPAGKSKVCWDGYDWRGNPMPLGEYDWKAYASPGLKPVYLGAFSTSGTPPYNTADGKGGWGGDHGQPIDVCADESGIYFLWDNNEAAKAFVKIGYDDKNMWRNSAFVEGGYGPYSACATNGKYLYVIWGGTKKTYLARFNAANGLSEPFSSDTAYVLVNDCQLDKNPVGSADSFDNVKNPRSETIGLAANATEVYATSYSKNKIFVFNADTGEKLRELDCPWPRGICVDKSGDLYAISCNLGRSTHHAQGSSVLRFPKGQAPSSSAFQLYGLSAPWDISVDANGRFFVTDAGYSNQIWVYEKDRTHLGWIGKKGGRPYYGAYDKSGMLHPTGVCVDVNGKIVVAQNSIPAVFQRFSADSFAVDREWFGEVAYGPPSWPSPNDPLTVYAIYKDDPKIIRGTVKGDGSNGSVSAYWDMNKMNLPAPFSCLSICTYTSWVNFIGPNGVEFMFDPSTNSPYNAHAVFRVSGDELIPIAYVKSLGVVPSTMLNDPPGLELWSDLNHNGKVDESEIVRVTELAGQKLDGGFIGMASMWMNAKGDLFLSHTSNIIFKIPAKSVDKEGAIVWDTAKAGIAASDVIPGSDHAGTSPRAGILGFRDDPQGNLYTCINIGKHAGFKYASKEWNEAMLPGPGHTGNFNVVKYEKFGPDGKRIWMAGRKATGTARPGEIYHTWIMAGLAGDGYPAAASEWTPVSFYTPDGFFVDTVLGDPNKGGEPDEYFIGGGENFTGRVTWFQERGECYLYTGNCHPNVYRIDGFGKDGKIKGEIRFAGKMNLEKHVNPYPPVEDVAKAPVEIVKLVNPFDSKQWGDKPSTLIGNNGGELAKVNVGYDDTFLYAKFDVKDTTPMENKADDEKQLFKWGDSVGIYLGKSGRHDKIQAGDIRLLASEFKGKPVVVAMIPEGGSLNRPAEYFTPAGGTWKFVFVGVLDDASVRFTKQPNSGYTAELKIPLKLLESLGLSVKPGEKLSFDSEVLLSGFGQRGFQTMARNHMFTSRSFVPAKMVDDIPSEARLYPAQWGEAVIK
ncbi:MAG: hypothetical protein WAX69_21270 [Victivallales bacterium]